MKRLATAAALGALALTAIPAEAGDKAKTEVSLVAIVPIGMAGYSYEGTIQSKKKCADKRKVIVYRKQPGKDEKIGSTKANGAVGAWAVQHPDQADGTYHAKAPATKECEGDKSGKLTIKPVALSGRRAAACIVGPHPQRGQGNGTQALRTGRRSDRSLDGGRRQRFSRDRLRQRDHEGHEAQEGHPLRER